MYASEGVGFSGHFPCSNGLRIRRVHPPRCISNFAPPQPVPFPTPFGRQAAMFFRANDRDPPRPPLEPAVRRFPPLFPLGRRLLFRSKYLDPGSSLEVSRGVRHSGPSDVNKTEAGGPAGAGSAAPNLKPQACLRKGAAVRLYRSTSSVKHWLPRRGRRGQGGDCARSSPTRWLLSAERSSPKLGTRSV